MMWIVIFALAPVVLYISLVALPRGKGAWIGLGVAGLPIAGLWLARLGGIGPLFGHGAVEDNYASFWLIVLSGALVLAGVAQALRPLFGPRARYVALCIGLALAASVPTIVLLGL